MNKDELIKTLEVLDIYDVIELDIKYEDSKELETKEIHFQRIS